MHLTHILAGQKTRGLAAVDFEYFERFESVLAMTSRVENADCASFRVEVDEYSATEIHDLAEVLVSKKCGDHINYGALSLFIIIIGKS